jgi:hypothetical protein
MEEQLISFDTSKLAKEKGFDVPTLNFYGLPNKTLYVLKNGESLNPQNHNDNELVGKNRSSAPTQSLLQKWLRDVHGLHIEVMITNQHIPVRKMVYTFITLHPELTENRNVINSKYYPKKPVDTYEEALEQGLIESLKLID